jgi:hypothetical protein
MTHLRAGTQVGVLNLAKIAHVNAFSQVCTLSQAGKWANIHFILDYRAI